MTITFVNKAWTDEIITRLARSLTYRVVTKTKDNITGDELLTPSGSSSTYSGVFTKIRSKWDFSKEGLFDGGDAYAIFKAETVTPGKNDLITVGGETYRVDNVITRYSDDDNATAMYHYCNLFLNSA